MGAFVSDTKYNDPVGDTVDGWTDEIRAILDDGCSEEDAR